jgi:hypothetical protein
MLLGAETSKRTAAVVIARPNELPYDLLQIDQGSRAGIQEDSLVYIGDDQLLGMVVSVQAQHSFVQPFTSPGIEMTGFISGPDVVAAIEGIGGGVARVRVPQGVPLNIGDLVYVPSIQPGLFGRIDYIENRPSQPEQFGYITLRVPLQGLYAVAVADQRVESIDVDTIELGKERIIAERLLREDTHTVSFEQLLATSSPATSTAPTTTETATE